MHGGGWGTPMLVGGHITLTGVHIILGGVTLMGVCVALMTLHKRDTPTHKCDMLALRAGGRDQCLWPNSR